LPPPDEWLAALAAELGQIAFNRYPDRHATELRRALAQFHGVRTEQVFCANGSNEVLQSLCLAYGGPGRSVAVFEPTYALHSHIAHLTGTEVFEGQRRPDFSLDLDAVGELISERSPTLTFLCSPNNPTGLAEAPATVRAVLSEASGLLVVDEAYGQFADWSALSLVDDDTPLVVTRTFSKTWSMAAARLGYLVGPEQVVTDLERVVLPYHLDAVKQAGGRLALRYVGEMEQRVGLIVRERQRILAGLGRLPVTIWPSQSNFILFRPDRHKGEDVWRGLLERGILIRNTSSWPGLTGCLRVTVGTPEENDAFLGALAEVLS
ncbi:MAG TPA: histidinol-phosphate transaminase, partial [Acidimicrobiales bacterium]|nr:histidinol-phosphate transaminase [Acidimicrobiales bacterium]